MKRNVHSFSRIRMATACAFFRNSRTESRLRQKLTKGVRQRTDAAILTIDDRIRFRMNWCMRLIAYR
jgi:hypothetical protein